MEAEEAMLSNLLLIPNTGNQSAWKVERHSYSVTLLQSISSSIIR